MRPWVPLTEIRKHSEGLRRNRRRHGLRAPPTPGTERMVAEGSPVSGAEGMRKGKGFSSHFSWDLAEESHNLPSVTLEKLCTVSIPLPFIVKGGQ